MDPLRFVKFWRSECGAELVEFALSFPLLLLVTMGIIDFGLLFQRYEVLTNAAREGARILVLPDYGPADVEPRVQQYLQGTGLAAGTVTTVLAADTLPVGGGRCVTVRPVRVTYVHQYMFVGGIMSYFGSSLGSRTLTATASMRREIGAVTCP